MLILVLHYIFSFTVKNPVVVFPSFLDLAEYLKHGAQVRNKKITQSSEMKK